MNIKDLVFKDTIAKGYDGEYYTEADECIEEDW